MPPQTHNAFSRSDCGWLPCLGNGGHLLHTNHCKCPSRTVGLQSFLLPILEGGHEAYGGAGFLRMPAQ